MATLRSLLLFFALMLSITAVAAPRDYVLERAYVEDASNAMTWQQVQQQALRPFNGLFTKGYSASTFWLRLKVAGEPTAAEGEKLILRLEPTYLDEVQLFDPMEPKRLNRFTGDRHAMADYEYQSAVFNFAIPASAAPRYVWLRLKTTSTNLLLVRAFKVSDEQKIDRQYQVVMAVMFVLVLVFVLWGLGNWLIYKDRLLAVFTVRQAAGLLFVAAYVGYFRLFLSDQWSPASLDYLTSAMILLTSFTTLYFHYVFFSDYELKPIWNKVFVCLLMATPLELLFVWAGHLTTALAINMSVLMLLPFFMMLLVFVAIDWPSLATKATVMPKRFLIVTQGVFLAVGSLTTIPSLGFKSLTNLAPHLGMVHGGITGLVMLGMLHYRNRRVNEQRMLEVSLANQEALYQKKQRDTERNFLEMLTHEFRTSLSVVRMAIGSGSMAAKEYSYADKAILSMDQVIERCQQVQQLADGQINLHADTVHVPQLLRDLVAQSAEEGRIRLNLAEVPSLQADEKLLRIAVSNLLDNALKYSPKGSPVTLDLRVLNGQLTLSVGNAVGPVGRPDPAKVFQKYYRAEKAHGAIGSGLGLFIIKNMVTLMGGELRYAPSDTLVSFELCLPL